MALSTVYSIGRATDNSIVIAPDHRSVSKYHASVRFITDQVILLEDKESTYGTIVDGRRVQQTIIGPDSQIILGEVYSLDFRSILALRQAPLPKQPPPAMPKADVLDFREEFKALAKVQELYLETREAIQLNSPRQQGRLRAGLALIPMVGFAFGPAGPLIGAAIGCVSQILAAEFLNPQQKLIALEKEYKLKYVCPNPDCNRPLGNTPYIDLVTRKQCPTCKAKWAG